MPGKRVALIRGSDRYRNTRQALEAIADDIQVESKKRIIIKPNFVSTSRQVAATHRDGVRALLDFLRERGIEGATLAEGPAMGRLESGLENYGYLPLIKEYSLKIVALNRDEPVEVELYDRRRRPLILQAARTAVESDYRISIGPPKTHDYAIVTLSLKNMAVGSLLSGQKSRCHQDIPGININLFRMARYVAPHLAILDGFVAMEGNGPCSGEAVDWRVAIASTDFVAADSLCSDLMGFPPHEVGYLHYCHLMGLGQGDPSAMEIVGNVTPDAVRRRFKPHRDIAREREWHIPNPEQYLI